MKIDVQLDNNLDVAEDPDTLDLVEGPADEQHQQLLLITKKGAWKETPETGAGIENYLNDDDINGMLREVRSQFEADGQQVNSIDFNQTEGQLIFDAYYNS